MKKFLSVILTFTLFTTPLVSLNCFAVNEETSPAQVTFVSSPVETKIESVPKQSNPGKLERGLELGAIISMIFISSVLLTESFSKNGQIANSMGVNVGQFIKAFKTNHPDFLSNLESSSKQIKDFFVNIYNLATKNVNAFKIGFNNGLIK